jgi:hypothetical protein
VWKFAVEFDGHTFLDDKGNVYRAHVEYAPYQRMVLTTPMSSSSSSSLTTDLGPQLIIPSQVDKYAGTINEDPDYLNFLASLSKSSPTTPTQLPLPVPEPKKPLPTTTPLLEELRAKALAKLRVTGERQTTSTSSSSLTSTKSSLETTTRRTHTHSRERRTGRVYYAPKHVLFISFSSSLLLSSIFSFSCFCV